MVPKQIKSKALRVSPWMVPLDMGTGCVCMGVGGLVVDFANKANNNIRVSWILQMEFTWRHVNLSSRLR